MNIFTKIQSFRSFLKKTKEDSGKSYLFLMKDFLSLRKKMKIQLEEYYNFEFEKQPDSFRNTFLCAGEQPRYLKILNPKKYYILARNKFIAHLFLDKFNIRKTRLYCYYHPEGRYSNNSIIGYNFETVKDILMSKNVQSCVIKTTESSHGEGVIVINKIEYFKDECLMYRFDGQIINLKEILKYEPLIFEQIIMQSAQFNSFNQTSVNTVRFMTTLYPDGNANLVCAFIKIGREGSCVDNAGSGGNVDAAVDIDTGVLYNVIQFDGWRKTKSITHHPDSGRLLEGVYIQNWNEIKQSVLSFQKSMPFLKAIGWDIAITDDGPVVVEINDNWETTGQLFIGRGWKEEIRNCYLAWKDLVDKGLVSYKSGRGID